MASFLKTGNSYSGDTEDLSRLCRTCASSNDYLIPIFEGEGLDHGLAVKIEKYLPVKILEGDTLPSQVCYQCASTLIAWHDLFENSIKAEKKLRDLEDRKVFADKLSDIDRMKELECSSAKAKKSKKISTKSEPSQNFAEGEGYQHLSHKAVNRNIARVGNRSTVYKEENNEQNHTLNNIMDISSLVNAAYMLDFSPKKDRRNIISDKKFENRHNNFDINNMQQNSIKKTSDPNKKMEKLKNSVKSDTDNIRLEKPKKNSVTREDIIMRGKLKRYFCHGCQRGFQFKSELLRHIFRCKPKTLAPPKGTVFTCDICGKKFSNKYRLSSHFIRHREKQTCHICGKIYTYSHFNNHLKHVHGGTKSFHCDICDIKLTVKSTLRNHMRIHTGDKPFMCSTCGKFFRSTNQLGNHKVSHSDTYPFSCSICNKPFRRSRNLKIHMLDHSGMNPFSCDICGKTFKDNTHLGIHRAIHFDSRPFVCPKCGKSFKTSGNLRQHRRRTKICTSDIALRPSNNFFVITQ